MRGHEPEVARRQALSGDESLDGDRCAKGLREGARALLRHVVARSQAPRPHPNVMHRAPLAVLAPGDRVHSRHQVHDQPKQGPGVYIPKLALPDALAVGLVLEETEHADGDDGIVRELTHAQRCAAVHRQQHHVPSNICHDVVKCSLGLNQVFLHEVVQRALLRLLKANGCETIKLHHLRRRHCGPTVAVNIHGRNGMALPRLG
mmetsp:Transcript_31905/g.91967  ORF Transcript_31905/g.91967 Transcript_31905/m.91967 type:complete len:204 (+) Transcript_31905:338-949(+)